MRKKLTKRISLIAVTLITILVIGNYLKLKNPNHPKIINTYLKSKSVLDPNNITKDYQYTILASMYLSLFNYENLVLSSEICQKFYWEGNSLNCQLFSNVTTKSGYLITAKDIQSSLLRSIHFDTSSHFSLKSLLKEQISTKNSPSISHPSIEVKGDFELTLHFKKKSSQIFEILSSADFSIIPRIALSKDNTEIINKAETSGYYHLYHEDQNTQKFKLNPRFKNSKFSDEIIIHYDFLTPEMIDDKSGERYRTSIIDKKINYIPFVAYSTENFRNKLNDLSNFNLISTLPLSSFDGRWTTNSSDISKNNKLIIASKIKSLFENSDLRSNVKLTNQFFIENSFGSIKTFPNWSSYKNKDLKLERKITVGGPAHRWLKNLLAPLEEYINVVPATSFDENNIDIYFVNVDLSYRASKTALSSYFAFGAFEGLNLTRDQFFSKLNSLDTDEQISEYAKEINDKITNESATLIPLCKFPYEGIVSTKYKINFDPYSALVPFQNITWE